MLNLITSKKNGICNCDKADFIYVGSNSANIHAINVVFCNTCFVFGEYNSMEITCRIFRIITNYMQYCNDYNKIKYMQLPEDNKEEIKAFLDYYSQYDDLNDTYQYNNEVEESSITNTWNYDSAYHIYRCSNCNFDINTADVPDFHYCPSCGAEME